MWLNQTNEDNDTVTSTRSSVFSFRCRREIHSIVICRGTLEELESVLTQARMFQWKPDGEVAFILYLSVM